jgi:hypothetical protein
MGRREINVALHRHLARERGSKWACEREKEREREDERAYSRIYPERARGLTHAYTHTEGLLTHIPTHPHTRAHLESLACASAALERGWGRGNIKRERLRRKQRPDRRGGAGGFGGSDGRLRSVAAEQPASAPLHFPCQQPQLPPTPHAFPPSPHPPFPAHPATHLGRCRLLSLSRLSRLAPGPRRHGLLCLAPPLSLFALAVLASLARFDCVLVRTLAPELQMDGDLHQRRQDRRLALLLLRGPSGHSR